MIRHELQIHRKGVGITGKVTELQFAEWLERRGWEILALEALREGPDVEAVTTSVRPTALEIKSFGTEDGDFEMILRSLAGDPAGGVVSPYSAVNYLIFRIYEAAKQSAGFNGRRVAAIVIASGDWWRFKMQLENGWVDWSNATFYEQDTNWETFIRTQLPRYPSVKTEVSAMIRELDAIWIQRASGYEYHLSVETKGHGA